MIDHAKIRQALRRAYLTIPELREEQINWENRPFTPPTAIPDAIPVNDRLDYLWFKEFLVPIETATVANKVTMFQAYMQLDVMYPSGRGNEVPEGVVAKILQKFRAPLSLQDEEGEFNIQIYKVDRSQGYDAGAFRGLGSFHGDSQVWYQIPTFIYFRVYDADQA